MKREKSLKKCSILVGHKNAYNRAQNKYGKVTLNYKETEGFFIQEN
jgi:hypothetical protein